MTFKMTIDGQSVAGQSALRVVNPATAKVFAQAPDCTRAELDSAVDAARRAFPKWAARPLEDRRNLMIAFADAIAARADELANLLTREQGKPLNDARSEVAALVGVIKTHARIDLPVHVAEDGPDRRVETRHLPLGVVGAISPWNYPLLLAAFKIAPALLTGNTMVLKPSPFTPLATLLVGEISVGILPDGVFNVVSGGDDLGPWITEHPGIDKISFTGSTQTGRRVMASASSTLKRLTLELGGNDAAIVLPDVDVETTAEKLFWSAFMNNGQVCIATKRLYVHDAIYDRMAEALSAYAANTPMGDGATPGVRLGPINNRPQHDRIAGLIRESHAEGHRFLTPCGPHEGDGFFSPVVLIDNPPDTSRLVREEQFGPILPLLRYHDIDEVVARANDVDVGLAGSVWAADDEVAIGVARRLDTGTVFINHGQYLSPFAAFGGRKQSGIGVENGVDGQREYVSPQTFVMAKR
ncbi:aldehyde dehydrogenase family protein [Brevundimonas sp.]|uniref:aldehyde dehydrogenase family protein n=1 Tax=Brevundimonas sp. TaxID=1871086 RepID=UPI001A2A8219|nr:aldehyde dehydrogenase family protein [Brevundimonas sp.]MBJ7483885.1 aldehyde dehydrogenase family protein [Brevundimonas sp.]